MPTLGLYWKWLGRILEIIGAPLDHIGNKRLIWLFFGGATELSMPYLLEKKATALESRGYGFPQTLTGLDWTAMTQRARLRVPAGQGFPT